MKPGQPGYLRRPPNPDLVSAYRQQLRQGTPSWKLALLAGFPQPASLSTIIHADRVVASPQTTARLERLRQILGFDGPIFADDPVSVAVAS